MKNFFLTAFLLALLTQQASCNDLALRTDDFPKQEMKSQNAEIAKMVAQEISEGLPQSIDKYTTFTNISAIDTTLVYTFEVNSGAKSDETIINEDKSRMQKAVIRGVCQSSSRFLEAGISTSYIYISATSKKQLFRFDIAQEDCIESVN